MSFQLLFLTSFFLVSGTDGFWVGRSSLKQWRQLAAAAQNFDSVENSNYVASDGANHVTREDVCDVINDIIDDVKPIESSSEEASPKIEARRDGDDSITEATILDLSASHRNDCDAVHLANLSVKRKFDGQSNVDRVAKLSKLEKVESDGEEVRKKEEAAKTIVGNVFNADIQCKSHGKLKVLFYEVQ